MRRLGLCILTVALLPGTAAAQVTDWGVRSVGGSAPPARLLPAPEIMLKTSGTLEPPPAGELRNQAVVTTPVVAKSSGGTQRVNLGLISQIGARWGRVTSTHRSTSHNRAVGGMPNSYHLIGRAIDIARRPGVSHWQIAAAFRAAGYNLLESLDEGDHSHFAFGHPGEVKARGRRMSPPVIAARKEGETQWRIVYAPGGGN